jgi:hypothetical protein
MNVTIRETTIKQIRIDIGTYSGWISLINGAKLVNDYENRERN